MRVSRNLRCAALFSLAGLLSTLPAHAQEAIVAPPGQCKPGSVRGLEDADSTRRGPTIELLAGGGWVRIVDHNAVFNCCSNVRMRADVSLDNRHITVLEDEVVQGNCRCVCSMKLQAEVTDLSPGTYSVHVYKRTISPENLIFFDRVEVPRRCRRDADCDPHSYCDRCGASSCSMCDDCVSVCVPHGCQTEDVAWCRMMRPECGENSVAIIENRCWRCVKLDECRPSECADVAGIDFGACEMLLGWANVAGRCQPVSGCSDRGLPFFSTPQECCSACPRTCSRP